MIARAPGPAMPALDVTSRVPKVIEALEESGCDGLLVTNMLNVRYLTGFTGSAGVLVVRPDGLVFITDGRYGDQATGELSAAGVDARIEVATSSSRDLLVDATAGIERLGLEAENVTWARQRELADEWLVDCQLIATTGIVEKLRAVKDEGEIARLTAACGIADRALAKLRHRLGERVTESEFALALDDEMRALGAESVSFDTIVASGRNGSRPHAQPSDRVIGEGDLVVIDFGATFDGYHSDMTRTVMVGSPSQRQGEMLEAVLAAQRAGVEAVRAGVEARDVDAACRDVLAEAGLADAFTHGTGHGIGLEIHEAPRVSFASDDTLVAGNVVTVEPGVYLGDHGGVRIEDSVVVTDDGCICLTNAPKDPTI